MKKFSVLFSLLLAATLLLAACGGSGQDNTATETTGLTNSAGGVATSVGVEPYPMLTETAMPGGTAVATESVAATATVAAGGAATQAGSTAMATEAAGGTSAAGGTAMGTPAGTGIAGTQAPSGTAAATESPLGTETVMASPEVSSTETMTSTLRGAAIEPADARRFLVLLSGWQGYDLVDKDGNVVGSIDDYVINLCEAHIVYMVVTSNESGAQMLVPYEAVSVNNGTIDVEGATISVNLDASQISGAPTVEQLPDLTTADWETGVRDYWGGVVSLSSLGTGCNVTAVATQTAPTGQNLEGTTVIKLVYASALQGAALQDGNGTPLGTVRDAVVEPESGQLFYLAVAREGMMGQGAVLVPLGAVNLADTQAPEGPATLVLLVDTNVLQEAPTIASLGDLTTNEDPAAHDYWSQYVQLGPGPVSTTTP